MASELSHSPQPPYSAELEVAQQLARQAGAVLRRFRQSGFGVQHKTGADDLVTDADREASALIVAGLRQHFPGDGILSEEETDDAVRLGHERVWSIDPIDGTKEFATGNADYCVSIGLAVGGVPVLGVVYAPETDELFSGAVGLGITKNDQPAAFSGRTDYIISVSDSEYGRELKQYDLPGMKPSGSIALKLARIAAGEADTTFSISPRSEWDICAGDALLRVQGGEVRRRDGTPIQYNQARPHIEQGIMGGRADALAWLAGELLARAIPVTHLDVRPPDPAWALLAEPEHPQDHRVCLRYGGGQVLARLVLDTAGNVVQATGDAYHLTRLVADAVRAGLVRPEDV